MTGEELNKMLQDTSHHMLAWQTHQPEELRAIEKLVIDLSKAVYHYRGGPGFRDYVNEVCEEIKQQAHDYQRKAGYKNNHV